MIHKCANQNENSFSEPNIIKGNAVKVKTGGNENLCVGNNYKLCINILLIIMYVWHCTILNSILILQSTKHMYCPAQSNI